MADIGVYLKNILSARYGRDVRQSIHDGIDAINKEVAADKEEVVSCKDSATKSASAAAVSETNAKKSETTAGKSASAANASESNAKASATAAGKSATAAEESATTASTKASEASASATAAANSATTAADKATTASTYANNANSSASIASTHATTASTKASEASTSANAAALKANSASNAATLSESYAKGGTGTRDREDVDNAKYYKEQAERISQGLNGALLPMGTIQFTELASQTKKVGYMYNISDSFTTDSTFKEGSGFDYAPGTNVYYTADGYWDCIAGTSVVGVKGSAENTYRTGNVNITPADIGMGNVDDTSDENKPISKKQQEALNLKLAKTGDTKDNTVTFITGDSINPTGWADIVAVVSEETHASLFRKISLAIKNVRYLYKILGKTDISAIGDGTATGAINALNSKLMSFGSGTISLFSVQNYVAPADGFVIIYANPKTSAAESILVDVTGGFNISIRCTTFDGISATTMGAVKKGSTLRLSATDGLESSSVCIYIPMH